MPIIINLTQHAPTPEQREAGVGDVIPDAITLLNFTGIYDYDLVVERANALVEIAKREFKSQGYSLQAMIGGLPALMAPLQELLLAAGFGVCYAISDRVSTETPQPDGTVKKSLIFKHIGFLQSVATPVTTTEKYTEIPEVAPQAYLYHEYYDLRESLRREVEDERLFRSRAARCPKRVFPFAPRSMEQAKAWLHEVRWGWSEAVPLTRSERDDVVRWIEANIMFMTLGEARVWEPYGGKPVDVPAGLNEFEERRFILIESYRQKAERRLERLRNPEPDPVQYPDGLPLWIAERLVPGWGWGDDDD